MTNLPPPPKGSPDVFGFYQIKRNEYVSFVRGEEVGWGQVMDKVKNQHFAALRVESFEFGDITVTPENIISKMCYAGHRKLWSNSREEWFCPFCNND